MKLKFSLLFAFASLFAGQIIADSEVDGIWYDFDYGKGTATVTNGSTEYVDSVIIPDSVIYNQKTYTVISIGNYAFTNCERLTSITIPNSVTSIGIYAFYTCRGLTSITIPNSVTSIGYSAFSGCPGLTDIIVENGNTKYHNTNNCLIETERKTLVWGCSKSILPTDGSLTSIGYSAFYGCTGLTSISIPNSVTSIGGYAFYNCTGLTSISIPNSVTSIEFSAFYGCTGLTSISIPNSVTSIGANAFNSCTGLTSISIPESVRRFGNDVFDGCRHIKSFTCLSTQLEKNDAIVLGRSIFSISEIDTVIMPAACYDLPEPEWAGLAKNIKYVGVTNGELSADGFSIINRSYKTLKTIDLEHTTNTEITDEAFKACYNLERLKLPAQTEHIGYMAVSECVMLQEIDIPASVTEISDRAFENCRSLQTITFGGKAEMPSDNDTVLTVDRAADNNELALKRIGNWAFYNCHELHDLEIPEGVTEVGAAAFYGCVYLENLSLPSSVQSIGENGFALCAKLKSISVAAKTPPIIEAKTFYNVNREIPLLVPESAVEDYANDPFWCEFVNIKSLTEDISVIKPFTVTLLTNDESMGSVIGAGEYLPDSTIEIQALANKGFAFVRWSDGDVNASRSIRVISDMTLTAEFVKLLKVTLYANDESMGSVSGAGEYLPNSTIEIQALANKGFAFVRWSDGYGNASRSIRLTSDLTLTAIFAPLGGETAIQDVETPEGVFAEDGRIVGAGNLQIFNLTGQDVTHLNGHLKGIYIVKIKDKTQRVFVR